MTNNKNIKTLVKINADGINSRFGYIMEQEKDVALIKVTNSKDWSNWLTEEHCVLLGNKLFKAVY